MNAIHYIGFDVHKKTISFCIKTAAGQIVEEGRLQAERTVLRRYNPGQTESVLVCLSVCLTKLRSEFSRRNSILSQLPVHTTFKSTQLSNRRLHERGPSWHLALQARSANAGRWIDDLLGFQQSGIAWLGRRIGSP